MDSVTKKRGGPREGAGRKPQSEAGEAMKLRSIRMTDAEWQKLLELGGSQWVRQQIAKAKLEKK